MKPPTQEVGREGTLIVNPHMHMGRLEPVFPVLMPKRIRPSITTVGMSGTSNPMYHFVSHQTRQRLGAPCLVVCCPTAAGLPMVLGAGLILGLGWQVFSSVGTVLALTGAVCCYWGPPLTPSPLRCLLASS